MQNTVTSHGTNSGRTQGYRQEILAALEFGRVQVGECPWAWPEPQSIDGFETSRACARVSPDQCAERIYNRWRHKQQSTYPSTN